MRLLPVVCVILQAGNLPMKTLLQNLRQFPDPFCAVVISGVVGGWCLVVALGMMFE